MYHLLTKDELTGHDVWELAPGKPGQVWGCNSVYLREEELALLHSALAAGVPHLNWFGPAILYEQDWNRVMDAYQKGICPPEAEPLVLALDAFMRDCLLYYGAVTWYGV